MKFRPIYCAVIDTHQAANSETIDAEIDSIQGKVEKSREDRDAMKEEKSRGDSNALKEEKSSEDDRDAMKEEKDEKPRYDSRDSITASVITVPIGNTANNIFAISTAITQSPTSSALESADPSVGNNANVATANPTASDAAWAHKFLRSSTF